jgi:hypothetical protein
MLPLEDGRIKKMFTGMPEIWSETKERKKGCVRLRSNVRKSWKRTP